MVEEGEEKKRGRRRRRKKEGEKFKNLRHGY